MGAPWRMPSNEQQKELKNNCSIQWTQQNDVNGTLVTGPSGGQIFFPNAGYRWDDKLLDAESEGHYWSGSLHLGSDGSYDDFYLCFMYGSWAWAISNRCVGLSVRACARS